MNKIFVLGGTKTGTSHCQVCLETMFPNRRIASCSKQGDDVWTTKLLAGDMSFLDDADIFLDGGRWDYVLPDAFLETLDPEHTIVLNRNPVDWLFSEMAYFDEMFKIHHKTPKKLLLLFLYMRNTMYYKFTKYGFKKYSIDKDKEMIDWLLDVFPTNISEVDLTRLRTIKYNSNTYEKDDPNVLYILEHLNITPEEAESDYIMRLL